MFAFQTTREAEKLSEDECGFVSFYSTKRQLKKTTIVFAPIVNQNLAPRSNLAWVFLASTPPFWDIETLFTLVTCVGCFYFVFKYCLLARGLRLVWSHCQFCVKYGTFIANWLAVYQKKIFAAIEPLHTRKIPDQVDVSGVVQKLKMKFLLLVERFKRWLQELKLKFAKKAGPQQDKAAVYNTRFGVCAGILITFCFLALVFTSISIEKHFFRLGEQ